MKKPKAKKSRSDLIKKELYKLAMEITHMKPGCELCGRSEGTLHSHHMEGRAGSLKWWLEGLILLCFRCHVSGIHDVKFSRQQDIARQIKELKGEELLNSLVRLKDRKFSTAELEEKLEEYKQIKENM